VGVTVAFLGVLAAVGCSAGTICTGMLLTGCTMVESMGYSLCWLFWVIHFPFFYVHPFFYFSVGEVVFG
jgi:hypothetical protein